METIEITNFGGRLTRILNGELNSGFAKFATSFGYDPFSKPMNLTWLETPVDITGGAISDLILDGKIRFETYPTLYAIGSNGMFYQIQIINSSASPPVPQANSVIGITSIVSGSPTFHKGASLEMYGSTLKAYIGNDNQVNVASVAGGFGTGDAVVGNASDYSANSYRPLKRFAGDLVFGNGQTIGIIDSTGTVTSSVIGMSIGNVYSALNPPLETDMRVKDLDVSPDLNYLLISTSSLNTYENVDGSSVPTFAYAIPTEGNIFNWNGSDQTVTAGITLPENAVTALQTYLQNNMFFSYDTFGASLHDGTNKILTLPNNKPPVPNATGANANFLYWIAPEKALNGSTPTMYASMYYFGSLDQENPPGLYRLCRLISTQTNGNIISTPFNMITETMYQDVNDTASSVMGVGVAQHYFSTLSDASGTKVPKLYYIAVPSTGSGTPQSGVYETQTQLFGQRVSISQIRVYTEPTASGNGFQIDCIGSDGSIISGGTGTYSYTAGTDITKLQGSLERINFNPSMKPIYALGLRFTNTGTTNMTIKKVEVDWEIQGK